jgi:hypothetical protein
MECYLKDDFRPFFQNVISSERMSDIGIGHQYKKTSFFSVAGFGSIPLLAKMGRA